MSARGYNYWYPTYTRELINDFKLITSTLNMGVNDTKLQLLIPEFSVITHIHHAATGPRILIPKPVYLFKTTYHPNRWLYIEEDTLRHDTDVKEGDYLSAYIACLCETLEYFKSKVWSQLFPSQVSDPIFDVLNLTTEETDNIRDAVITHALAFPNLYTDDPNRAFAQALNRLGLLDKLDYALVQNNPSLPDNY